jgi:hypothetical protein
MLPAMDENFEGVIREVDAFLEGTSKVQRTLERVQRALDELGIDFAVAGALAVGARGHLRLTVDVDLVVTDDGLRRFLEHRLGRGYVEKFPGSHSVRDVETGVHIDFLRAGDYPGDGRPKAVRFPDPAQVPPDASGLRILDLRTLIELKLASGITAPDRLQDLADVVALVRANQLTADFGASLDPLVRDKFAELWQAAQSPPRDL